MTDNLRTQGRAIRRARPAQLPQRLRTLRAVSREQARQGLCPDGVVLRASVPVGARPGNPAGMIMAPLPVGTADPSQRLQAISAETARRKQHPGEGIAGIVAMPASLARPGVAWARHAAACSQACQTILLRSASPHMGASEFPALARLTDGIRP